MGRIKRLLGSGFPGCALLMSAGLFIFHLIVNRQYQARIAAHAADLVKGVPGAREWDLKMAQARKELDWQAQLDLAIDPELAREKRGARNPQDEGACSMCGDYCAVEIIHKYFDKRECPCND